MVDETNNAANATLGKFKVGGYAYWAPKGTALPTDCSTALADDYKLLGYLNEDGVTITTDTETTEVKDANGTTIMKVISSFSESYQFVLAEIMRAEAAKLRYGTGAVTGEDRAMTVKHAMPTDESFILVFELAMTGDVKDRMVIGNATRAEFGDRKIHSGDPQGYDVTCSANDMDGTGVTAIEYIGVAAKQGQDMMQATTMPDNTATTTPQTGSTTGETTPAEQTDHAAPTPSTNDATPTA